MGGEEEGEAYRVVRITAPDFKKIKVIRYVIGSNMPAALGQPIGFALQRSSGLGSYPAHRDQKKARLGGLGVQLLIGSLVFYDIAFSADTAGRQLNCDGCSLGSESKGLLRNHLQIRRLPGSIRASAYKSPAPTEKCKAAICGQDSTGNMIQQNSYVPNLEL